MFKFILPKLKFNIEVWKWNKEYRVYVSNLGHFKDEHKNIIPIKIINSGYIVVDTPYGHVLAHRLVMYTFKPIPNSCNLTVDHLNHNKRDNSLNNLEWVTKEENIDRSKRDYVVVKYKPAKVKPKENKGDAKKAFLQKHADMRFKTRAELKEYLCSQGVPCENDKKIYKKLDKARRANEPYFGFYTAVDFDGVFYCSKDRNKIIME